MLFQPRRRKQLMPRHSLKQQGVVIIVALFIVALVASLAYFMMARLERDTNRALMLSRNQQAAFYAAGSVAWAEDQLKQNWLHQNSDRVIDKLPLTSPKNVENGYQIESTITDAQSYFNLNNLSNSSAKEGVVRLIRVVKPDYPESEAKALADETAKWLGGAPLDTTSAQYYLDQKPPYRASERLMASSTEWLLVKGMTPDLFAKLKPFVTALPVATPINVQTASAAVLTTLSPNLNTDTANALITLRTGAPFLTPEKFLNQDIVKNNAIKADEIVIASQYFWVMTQVSIENQHSVFYTLLKRSMADQKPTIDIIWQSRGSM